MDYIYHAVPNNMQESTLYPLNILQTLYPDIYKEQVKKYIGRERIMEQRIPKLLCLWNDVLHFSAVHPKYIKHALIHAGGKKDLEMRYYQIDPYQLDPEKCVVYLYAHTSIKEKMNEENFASYDPGMISQYSIMPEETIAYYREMYEKGERPLLYHKIPHILYNGVLDVRQAIIITV